MNRRTFLGITASALAAFPLVQVARAQVGKRQLKKAINLAMCKDGASTLEKFQIIKAAGFDGVELNRPDAVPLDEVLRAKEASGLEIAGVTCTTHWGKPLSHQDPKEREQGFNGLKLALQEAGELGCRRVLLVPGVVNKDVPYDVCWERSVEAVKRAVPFAKEANCHIAIENVWNQFIMSPLEAVRYVEAVGSEWVGWHFDIGNVVTYGWPEQWVRILGPRILNVHIKDFSRKKRDTEGLGKGFNIELGEGDVSWPAVMKALDEIGYQGYGIAEVSGGDTARVKFLSERMSQLFAG
ncbi:MAG TPA: sugar phosphate isomerase/epimerase family protein [Chthoniobacteraceae bacterium]|jgi:L-ribulose-5-phosphate 3-epimerase|nr:sugar phosphate isomerase/epimerase family protein [Chthoniobacteraceae bacterium]